MWRTRGIGLALAAVLAISGLGAATASAEAPEFGRCLKVTPKSLSNFDNAKCVKVASEDAGSEAEKLKKGNYQWFSGVVNNKFTTKMNEATIVTLESVGGTKFTCRGGTGSGEYVTSGSNKDVAKVLLKFTGCEIPAGKLESPGAGEGNVNFAPLAGTIGFETITEDTPAKDHIALELHAEGGGNIAEFRCAGLPFVVRGSLLHKIAANAMKLTATEKFMAAKGKQKPEHFAGGTMGEHILEVSTGGGPFEQLGFTMAETLTNEEKIEASTVN
jgi:hypothetical protein